MGIELQHETRILVGRLCAPANPEMPWWWQASTTIDGAELLVGGLAATEHAAILEAAAKTIDFDWHAATPIATPTAPTNGRSHEPGWWPEAKDAT